MTNSRSNLPEGVEDILPNQAQELETLKRSLLDLYSSQDFQLIYPSIIEYADALGGEVNSELKNSAFTFYDDLSSNEIAIRPDISQQIARIDRASNKFDVQKYCYSGEVIKKRKDSFSRSRVTIKAGVEVFGSKYKETELIDLLLESFKILGSKEITISLGKTDALDELINDCAISEKEIMQLRKLISSKSKSNLDDWFLSKNIDQKIQDGLNKLMNCHGDVSSLEQIMEISNTAKKNAEELKEIVASYPDIDFHFDMTDFPGYDYHKGLVFSVHSSKHGFAIANGGEYQSKSSDNNIRNAIGFDIDLISLLKIKTED